MSDFDPADPSGATRHENSNSNDKTNNETNDKANHSMNERLDYLLSVALDDELDAAERTELDALLLEHPEAASSRRALLGSVDTLVQSLAATSLLANESNADVIARSHSQADRELEAGLAAIRSRIDENESGPADELAARRWALPNWAPPLAMAAAAVAIYLAVPQSSVDSFNPFRTDEGLTPNLISETAVVEGGSLAVDPIALAVVFELDEDADPIGLVDGVSAADFEIIEALELMEYMAAREGEGQG